MKLKQKVISFILIFALVLTIMQVSNVTKIYAEGFEVLGLKENTFIKSKILTNIKSVNGKILTWNSRTIRVLTEDKIVWETTLSGDIMNLNTANAYYTWNDRRHVIVVCYKPNKVATYNLDSGSRYFDIATDHSAPAFTGMNLYEMTRSITIWNNNTYSYSYDIFTGTLIAKTINLIQGYLSRNGTRFYITKYHHDSTDKYRHRLYINNVEVLYDTDADSLYWTLKSIRNSSTDKVIFLRNVGNSDNEARYCIYNSDGSLQKELIDYRNNSGVSRYYFYDQSGNLYVSGSGSGFSGDGDIFNIQGNHIRIDNNMPNEYRPGSKLINNNFYSFINSNIIIERSTNNILATFPVAALKEYNDNYALFSYGAYDKIIVDLNDFSNIKNLTIYSGTIYLMGDGNLLVSINNDWYETTALVSNDSNSIPGDTSELDSKYLRRDVANDVSISLSAAHGRGLKFWNSDSYKMYMSSSENSTWGGKLDNSSDYNMYFKMTGGTNRGFVFKNNTTPVAQIDAGGNMYLKGANINIANNDGFNYDDINNKMYVKTDGVNNELWHSGNKDINDFQRDTIKVVKGQAFNVSVAGNDFISNGTSSSGITVQNTNTSDGYIRLTGTFTTTGIKKVTISGINFIFDVADAPTSSTVTISF